MKELPIIKTDRLVLRQWRQEDLEPFAKLNADPRVMEYFPSTLSREDSDQLAKRMQTKIEENGCGFWAVSVLGIAEFIGFIGLNTLDPSTLAVPFAPAVEIGWRLAFDYWGKGYATEGARAALHYGFTTLHFKEIVSFTAVQNMRSRHVMEGIGMHHDPKEDFDHPKLPEGHRLRKHVLYRLKSPGKYTFKPYSTLFPELFHREKERIASAIKIALSIEHIGSTAVPNLGGKGIIDIAIAVNKKDLDIASEQLQGLGYLFRLSGSTPERLFFRIDLPDLEEGIRRYHVHLTYPESSEWKGLIEFRDYLKGHPEAVQKYTELKQQAALEANQDGETYRKIKEPLFKMNKSSG